MIPSHLLKELIELNKRILLLLPFASLTSFTTRKMLATSSPFSYFSSFVSKSTINYG